MEPKKWNARQYERSVNLRVTHTIQPGSVKPGGLIVDYYAMFTPRNLVGPFPTAGEARSFIRKHDES
jgi:hypothetical protein